VTRRKPHSVAADLSLLSAPTPATVAVHETSDARDLEQLYRGPTPKEYSFAPTSVTTLVLAPISKKE
jgi:hypothetical protein